MSENDTWDKRFQEGDIVEIPSMRDKWCYYIDKKYILSLVINTRQEYNPNSFQGILNKCSGNTFQKLLNIFDFPHSKNIQKILCSENLESIQFIMNYLRNEKEKKDKMLEIRSQKRF